ncbi:type I restriction enzyme HsdR N-terminal domain-containing protein [Echinicola jeungdonensis]|uniref:Type I restriction enzyme HsdR N-terminal domain-containing protein n=1 Tax=Echinicola jeungdonensis TaxID=709343 RepID=A0ABV5J0W2_9BACT|nr:type I restriction enzyme HsdR N-terminal domain-containing protein [Echinicola jeungdonensis]MDN3668292.1 type I restriction enzyme HsdR N-terminal domain-containing protein [Echinicola jeungdonensis]
MVDEKYSFLKNPLNLPAGNFKLEEEKGRLNVFDPLRKKFLVLTPEEWVRQHLIHYLVTWKNYPKSLFSLERGLKYNRVNKRFDILVLNRRGDPFLLIECKAPEVKLTQKTVEQVCVYNKSIGAEYIAISNGIQHICLFFDPKKEAYQQIREFPVF